MTSPQCPHCGECLRRDEAGATPFRCPRCGELVAGNFDLVSERTVKGIKFVDIRAKMKQEKP